MTRSQIVDQIKQQCIREYLGITDWIHDINHIYAVVRYGRKLAKLEHLSSKNVMLVELACWLHDLGRTREDVDPGFGRSSHAEYSYQMSKEILYPYRKQLGTEGVYKVLQAVREHNLPRLIHEENIVGRILVDADRGTGIRIDGIFKMLSFRNTIQCEPVYTQKEARLRLAWLLDEIMTRGVYDTALQQISYLKDWYYGNDSQSGTGAIVTPLYTKSAKKLYKRGIREIEMFERKLINLQIPIINAQ